nr:MAG TPA: hypothetical protein [Caudoviricetes sp.]
MNLKGRIFLLFFYKKKFKGSKKYLDFFEPLKYNRYIRR